jgi:RNA polymerase sigma factor (sigma-70 family)
MMNEKQYNEAVNLYADRLYRFILKNIGQQADAEDIVQSAYEKLWLNRENVIIDKCKSYLFTIAYNVMIDHIRKHKRVSLVDEFAENSAGIYNQENNLKKILDYAFTKLTELQKSLVLLKDYEGYSYAEIGQITNLNESQVKVYLHRARTVLKNFIVHPQNVM